MKAKLCLKDNGGIEGICIIIGVALCASLCLFKSSYANPSQRLNINAETEYKISDFQRDPEPALSSTGSNLSQIYRLYLDGALAKEGVFNSLFGVSLGDKYRKHDTDFENESRFDYGRWLSVSAISHHETDEDFFFSGAAEPQSPIHSVIKKYDTRLMLDHATSIEYKIEDDQRKDVLLGTVTGEKTKSETVRLRHDDGPINFSSEYREVNFDDLLGTRSDIRSRDLNLDMSYRPQDSFSVSAGLENKKDSDITNNTSLDSQDYRFELAVKPLKELRLRNRLKLSQDNDTKTGEDLSNTSDEITLNFDPVKQLGFEFAYKRAEEDKERESSDIDSTTNEEKLRVRAAPFSQCVIQSGYEVSDKSSTSSSENRENTKLFSDISLSPINNLKLGCNLSNNKQKNTFTSLIESDTNLIAGSLQYRINQGASLFMQADISKTDNPSTGAFTKTDTVSSNFKVEPFSFLGASLRTSSQETTGTSESALSQRLLNALEFDIKLIENLKVTTEYQLITSSGASASDENLFDIAAFYSAGKIDLSLRYQDRSVTGENPTDKATLLSNIKYRFSKDAALSFRFSLIDYTDKNTLANSYDSSTVESVLSMRF